MGICEWVRGLFRSKSSRQKRYSVTSNISMSMTSGSSHVRYDPTPPRLDGDRLQQPSMTSTPTQASSCEQYDRDGILSESALYFEGPLHDTSSSCLSDLSFEDDEDELFPMNDPRLQLSFSAPAGCILADSFGSGGRGMKEERRRERRKKSERRSEGAGDRGGAVTRSKMKDSPLSTDDDDERRLSRENSLGQFGNFILGLFDRGVTDLKAPFFVVRRSGKAPV